tara:strand:+ start:1205 stop:1534 length:330 start_codon:yes stop_codon:yes gene_type:complete
LVSFKEENGKVIYFSSFVTKEQSFNYCGSNDFLFSDSSELVNIEISYKLEQFLNSRVFKVGTRNSLEEDFNYSEIFYKTTFIRSVEDSLSEEFRRISGVIVLVPQPPKQ